MNKIDEIVEKIVFGGENAENVAVAFWEPDYSSSNSITIGGENVDSELREACHQVDM